MARYFMAVAKRDGLVVRGFISSFSLQNYAARSQRSTSTAPFSALAVAGPPIFGGGRGWLSTESGFVVL